MSPSYNVTILNGFNLGTHAHIFWICEIAIR